MYRIYYIKNNYMFRHFTLAIFRLRNEKPTPDQLRNNDPPHPTTEPPENFPIKQEQTTSAIHSSEEETPHGRTKPT